jgi:hypothetical protein
MSALNGGHKESLEFGPFCLFLNALSPFAFEGCSPPCECPGLLQKKKKKEWPRLPEYHLRFSTS